MFSELVDTVLARAKRPERSRDDLVAAVRATMRELHMLALFSRDLIEDEITTTASPHIWTPPSALRQLRAARYDFANDPIYPAFIQPGRAAAKHDYFVYRASNYYVFKGVDVGITISIAYYTYSRKFTYYASGARPATYNAETDTWTYYDLTASGGINYNANDTNKELARSLVGDWLLEYWDNVIEEGALAKFLKLSGDPDRAKSSFALFGSLKADILKAEQHEVIGHAQGVGLD